MLIGYSCRISYRPHWKRSGRVVVVHPLALDRSSAGLSNAGRALAARAFDVRWVVAAYLRIYQELIDKP